MKRSFEGWQNLRMSADEFVPPNVDLLDAAHQKMTENAHKRPVESARGSNGKYTEL